MIVTKMIRLAVSASNICLKKERMTMFQKKQKYKERHLLIAVKKRILLLQKKGKWKILHLTAVNVIQIFLYHKKKRPQLNLLIAVKRKMSHLIAVLVKKKVVI